MTLSVSEQKKQMERREKRRLQAQQWKLRTGYNAIHSQKQTYDYDKHQLVQKYLCGSL